MRASPTSVGPLLIGTPTQGRQAMNTGMVVRMDADASGAILRVWVDDETGTHLTVCEVDVSAKQIATLAREIGLHQEKAQQYEFDFH